MIIWKSSNGNGILAGTTLRDSSSLEDNSMALHCGGDKQAIVANREALGKEIGVPLSKWVFAQQTHSDHIKKVTQKDGGKGIYEVDSAIADSDALYTRDENVLIGVFHADCVPILLYDRFENIICAIHSGWMGTQKAITSKALQILIETEGCKAENIQAYIGPSIALASFEVGNEVIEKIKLLPFDTAPYISHKNNGKALLDNAGLNYQMLIEAGLKDEQITIDKNDTFQNNASFFSYRRDKNCGRHLSFIVRKSS